MTNRFRIEDRMLSISRIIFFTLSLVALIGFLIVSVKLVKDHFYTVPDFNINMDNIPDRYIQHKKHLKEKPVKEKADDSKTSNEVVEPDVVIEDKEPTIQEQFVTTQKRIVENINAYIHIVEGGKGRKVDEAKIFELLRNRMNRMLKIAGNDWKYPLVILDGLDSSIGHYLDRANEISKLDKGDLDRVDMRKYVPWYLEEYERMLESEVEKNNTARQRLREIKAQQIMTLYVWGSLFLTFILLTLFLVIFKIEKNTRPNK